MDPAPTFLEERKLPTNAMGHIVLIVIIIIIILIITVIIIVNIRRGKH